MLFAALSSWSLTAFSCRANVLKSMHIKMVQKWCVSAKRLAFYKAQHCLNLLWNTEHNYHVAISAHLQKTTEDITLRRLIYLTSDF